jgi:hypothetical protein
MLRSTSSIIGLSSWPKANSIAVRICRSVSSLSSAKSRAEPQASSALSAPFGPIVRPAEVELLDYEVEIGLVLRAPLTRTHT